MSLIINSRPLVIIPELAVKIGLNEAIVLQQLHYWIADSKSGVTHNGMQWVYNSYEQWIEQFPFWSVDTVKRALTSLKNQDLIYVEKINKSSCDHTNYYAINYDHSALIDDSSVHRSIGANCTDRTGQNAPISTETTTENTTDIKDSAEPKRKQEKQKKESTFSLPEKLNLDAWSQWTEYRKQQGFKPYKKVALGEGAAASKLIELAGGDPAKQLAIVNQSISNQWKGLFALKTEQQQKSAIRQTGFTASENPSCTVGKI